MNSQERNLGRWRVQPALNRLISEDGTVQSLDTKAMEVLVMLLAANGEVVSQDQLLDFVWKDRVVEPGVVHQKIRMIRAALEDDAKHPKYIETIYKRGYRVIFNDSAVPDRKIQRRVYYWSLGACICGLLLLVPWFSSDHSSDSEVQKLARGGTVWGLTTRYPNDKTVVILDFEDHSSGQDYAWLGKSIADDIRMRLTQGHKPHEVVPSLASNESRIEQGDYDFYMSGSIETKDEVVIVRIELVDKHNERQWSESLEAPVENLTKLRSRAAGWAAAYADLKMTDEQFYTAKDPEADRLIDQWPMLQAKGDNDGLIENMRRITKIEPSFVIAWELLGKALLNNGQLYADQSLLEEARAVYSAMGDKTGSRAAETSGKYVVSTFFEQDLPTAESYANENAYITGFAFHYADMMSRAGLHEQALDLSRRHAEIAPFWNDGWVSHAQFGARASREREVAWALENLDTISGTPQSTISQIWLMAQSDDALGLNELIKGYEDDMEEALPSSAVFRNVRGLHRLARFELLYKSKRYQEAEELLRSEFNPLRPWKAVWMFRLGNSVEAERMMQKTSLVDLALTWSVIEMFLTEEEKKTPFVQNIRSQLGYTVAWQKELCRRADLFPPESGIRCNNKP